MSFQAGPHHRTLIALGLFGGIKPRHPPGNNHASLYDNAGTVVASF
jgi:hypothetical protein